MFSVIHSRLTKKKHRTEIDIILQMKKMAFRNDFEKDYYVNYLMYGQIIFLCAHPFHPRFFFFLPSLYLDLFLWNYEFLVKV